MLRKNVQSETAGTRTYAGFISQLHITEFSTLQNNPQHTRVLVNDWLGTRLAETVCPFPSPTSWTFILG